MRYLVEYYYTREDMYIDMRRISKAHFETLDDIPSHFINTRAYILSIYDSKENKSYAGDIDCSVCDIYNEIHKRRSTLGQVLFE